MRDYREKDVKGMLAIWNPRRIPRFIHDTVTVRMTSDDKGQSLSLSAGNVLIEIPLEQVQDIIKVSERSED